MRKRFNGWQRTVTALILAAGLAAAPGEGTMSEAKSTPPAGTFGIDKASQPEADLIAAGQPTAEQLKEAAKAGYKTVLDLRPPAEERGFDEAKAAREAGLEYVNLPVTADTLDAATLDQFLEIMEKAERPVLVHCATSNRVGALYYAYLVLEKQMSREEALAKAKEAGLRSPELEQKVDGLLDRRPKS
jgi:uncharacterized protein (TIGR01244 family)